MNRKNMKEVVDQVSGEETSEEEQQETDDDLGDEEEENDVNEDDHEAEEMDNEDLDASATESDEDESDDGSDIEENEEKVKPKTTKSEVVKDNILKRYQERQGKQLYIRFPHKVPETQEALEKKIKELTSLVVKVHKPRQRYVRFCLVDFASNEDRDTAFKEIKKSIKKGTLGKYVVNIPRTESSEFVSELVERKIKSIENKKAKLRLKKASKKALKENHFTSTVIVLNLPKSASLLQIRELFPNAVDINIKPGRGKMNDKSIAAVTLPTTLDARRTIKKKLSLGGNQLVIKFDNQKLKEKLKSKKGRIPKVIKNEEKSNEDLEPEMKKPKFEADSNIEISEKGPKQKNLNAKKDNVKNKTKVGKK